MMSRRVVNITLDNLDDLPRRCRRCVRWELDPVARERAEQAGDPALEKEAWVSAVLLDWGSCGKLAYVDAVAAGYVLYAPPGFVPRSVAFPTSPVSADAVLLMTAAMRPEFAGGGIGRMLIQAVAKDLVRRGVRAIEAFGAATPTVGAAAPGAAEAAGRPGTLAAAGLIDWAGGEEERPVGPPDQMCLVPADYLLAVGFKTVRPHHRVPRLRLELKNALSWREDVEVALERLLGSMNPDPVLRPV